MPPRLRKRAKITYTEDDAAPEPTISSKDKKAISSGSTVGRRAHHIRSKRGGLEGLPNMPLDVLLQIFGSMHPRDLLNLARTSRKFRDFLMSRNAASLWKQSRKQLQGLPEPPPDISEPAYANFLFFNHCHGCLKGGAHVVKYTMFMARYCSSCKHDWLSSIPHKISTKIVKDFSDLAENEDHILNTDFMKHHQHGSMVYHKPEQDKVAKQWRALQRTTRAEKMKFVKKLIANVEQREEMAEALHEWDGIVKKEKLAKEDAIRDKRVNAVLQRLREEGWGEEVDKLSVRAKGGLASLEGVNRPTKLTAKGWKSICDAVFTYMQKVRKDRLGAEYNNMIQVRLSYLKAVLFEYVHSQWLLEKKDHPLTYASAADCALAPAIRAVLADRSDDVTKESIMTKLTDLVPVVATQWMEERKAECRSDVRAAFDAAGLTIGVPEPLDLALVTFKCQHSCSSLYTPSRFPQVLQHACIRENTMRSATDRYEHTISAASFGFGSLAVPIADRLFRNLNAIIVDPRFTLGCDVIKACGMDPNTATLAEMDACEARLRCLLCATLSKQEIFSWSTAIRHDLQHHSTSWQDPKLHLRGFWERISEEHAAQARELEIAFVKHKRTKKQYDNATICCAWCWCAPRDTNDMKRHMAKCHKVTKPKMDIDWILEIRPFTVWMYSSLLSEGANSSPEKARVEAGTAFYATF